MTVIGSQTQKREMVTIHAVFGQRRGESSPELLDAIDQYSSDGNPDWISKKLVEHCKNSYFSSVALVDIKIPYDEIRRRLSDEPVNVSGEVVEVSP